MNENLPDVSIQEKERDKIRSRIRKLKKVLEDDAHYKIATLDGVVLKKLDDLDLEKIADEIEDLEKDIEVLQEEIAKGHNYVFVGKVGLFAPVISGKGGGLLMREKEGKYYAAEGSTGYRWMEAESIHEHMEEIVDISYFTKLSTEAIEAIERYGADFSDFVDISGCSNCGLPWMHEPTCGEHSYDNCLDCPHWRIQLDNENYEEMFCCDKQ